MSWSMFTAIFFLSSSLPIFLSPSHLYLIVFFVFAFFLLFLIFVVIFFVHFFIPAASFFSLFFLFFIFPFLPPPCLYVGVQFHFVINVSLSLMEEMVLSPVNSPRGSKHRVLSCGRLGYKATTIQPGIISNKNFSGLDVNQSLLSNNDFTQITSSKNSTNIF